MAIDTAFLDARIARTKELIIIYEDAIAELGGEGGTGGGIQSYTLDTGQTRQTVTKAELGSLRLQLNGLDNRLSTLCARRDGASHYAR